MFPVFPTLETFPVLPLLEMFPVLPQLEIFPVLPTLETFPVLLHLETFPVLRLLEMFPVLPPLDMFPGLPPAVPKHLQVEHQAEHQAECLQAYRHRGVIVVREGNGSKEKNKIRNERKKNKVGFDLYVALMISSTVVFHPFLSGL